MFCKMVICRATCRKNLQLQSRFAISSGMLASCGTNQRKFELHSLSLLMVYLTTLSFGLSTQRRMVGWLVYSELEMMLIYSYNIQIYKIISQHPVIDTYFGMLAKLLKATSSYITSVCPHRITRLPLGRFLCNLIIEGFSKIFLENSSFIKIWQV